MDIVYFSIVFEVYIIFSRLIDRYYIGHTQNIDDRIMRHTNSGSKSTKKASDWVLKYTEKHETRSSAMKREMEIKRKKSRKYIEGLIKSGI